LWSSSSRFTHVVGSTVGHGVSPVAQKPASTPPLEELLEPPLLLPPRPWHAGQALPSPQQANSWTVGLCTQVRPAQQPTGFPVQFVPPARQLITPLLAEPLLEEPVEPPLEAPVDPPPDEVLQPAPTHPNPHVTTPASVVAGMGSPPSVVCSAIVPSALVQVRWQSESRQLPWKQCNPSGHVSSTQRFGVQPLPPLEPDDPPPTTVPTATAFKQAPPDSSRSPAASERSILVRFSIAASLPFKCLPALRSFKDSSAPEQPRRLGHARPGGMLG
jgi:hypothetical protein